MKILALLFITGLQSCTPVFAQSDAKAGSEKQSNEPSKWDSVKEKTSEALEETVEVGSEMSQKVGRTLGAARLRRQDTTWTIAANYSLFELWTLTKYGFTASYNKNATTVYEFVYTRGSMGLGYFGIDIGEVAEQRFGVNWRTYGQRNSFSFVTGLYYNDLNVHLGNDLLKTVGVNIPKVDILEIQTIGLHWGIGNRWQTKGGFVWGADWIALNVPLVTLKQSHPFLDATNNQEFRDDAQSALKVFRRIPEIAAVKIQLGFSW